MAGVSGFFVKLFAGGFFKSVVGRILVSVALGAIQARLAKLQAKKNAAASAGLRTEKTLAGSKNPLNFVLGRYVTDGQQLAPEYSWGSNNIFLTYPISVGFIRGQSLRRLIINGEIVELDSTFDATKGRNVVGKYAGKVWVHYEDGTQTVVNSFMSSTFGAHPQRPWLSDMIGRDVCIAYLTFQYDQALFESYPAFRFEMDGIKLYDVRKDSTAGGVGAHRWDNRATWEFTRNPVVMIYNILRGITVPDMGVWGGSATADDFRFSEWSSAMNKCDTPISGSLLPRYEAGYEVFLSDQPASVINELLKACGGEIADVGGIWRVSVGEPDAPVMFFNDDDILVTESSEFEAFQGVEESKNTISATYLNPDLLWQTTEAPVQTSATYVAEDDGRINTVDLPLNAVTRSDQAQDLATTLLADNRRFRQHVLPLPPQAVVIEPLDTVAWTSSYNGYAAKLFEVGQVARSLIQCLPRVSLRERDPDDYDFTSGMVVPFVPVSGARPTPEAALQSFAVAPFIISDGTNNRRPAIRLTWSGSLINFATGVEYEVRTLVGAIKVAEGSSSSPASGNHIIAEGVLPATGYQVRARVVANLYDCPWSSWLTVTTGDQYLNQFDIQVSSLSAISAQIGTFISGDPAGERMVITGDKIEIFDASNTLRVRIGDLS